MLPANERKPNCKNRKKYSRFPIYIQATHAARKCVCGFLCSLLKNVAIWPETKNKNREYHHGATSFLFLIEKQNREEQNLDKATIEHQNEAFI